MVYTRYFNTFDNGTQGAQITVANSGASGTAFTSPFSTGVATYDATNAIQGARGMLTETAASGAAFSVDFPAATNIAGFSFEFTALTLPTADLHIGRLNDSANTRIVGVHINSANKLRFTDASGTTGVSGGTAPDALVAGTKYRVELYAKTGTSTTTGELRGAYFLAGSTVPIFSFTNTAVNAGTGTPFTRFVFGRIATSSVQLAFDSVVWEVDGTALPGPYVYPATALDTPVVTLGGKVNPTTVGGTDGKQTVTWTAVANAVSYEAWIAHTSSPAQGDFTLIATNVTSPYQFTSLTAGTHAYGIKAKAS